MQKQKRTMGKQTDCTNVTQVQPFILFQPNKPLEVKSIVRNSNLTGQQIDQ